MQSIKKFIPRPVKKQLKPLVVSAADMLDAGAESLMSGQASHHLMIFDDYFPNLLTAFRIAEFNGYFKQWPNSILYAQLDHQVLKQHLSTYQTRYPEFAHQIKRYNPKRRVHGKLAYCIFLNNAMTFVSYFERNQIPFVFTLYPGGGLCIDDNESDAKLMRVLQSSNFRKVIVTQKITHEYLLKKHLCPEDRIEHIYGGVLPLALATREEIPKRRYGEHKSTFDICFVAYMYMEQGRDKGYDIFVDVARQLAKHNSDMRFHVVGNFDETDIDVSDISDQFIFYGTRFTDFFPGFHAGMDIFISANRSSMLSKGAFDGFPTGACIEAMLCGVAVFCTDPLNLNVAFTDHEDIVLISHEVDAIIGQILRYYEDTPSLYELARKGERTCQQVFGYEAQLQPRIQILSEVIEAG